MSEYDNPWQTVTHKQVYDNPWIRVHEDDVINPSGGEGIYGVVHFKNLAIGIVPVDDQHNTWLVGQYRYAVESYEWEIPAGGAPAGEPLVECAKRELLEETGLVAEHWDQIMDGLQLSNSITDELAHTFVARGLTQRTACPEDTEELQIRRVPLEAAIDMAITGQLSDAFSVVSLMRLKHLMLRNELRDVN